MNCKTCSNSRTVWDPARLCLVRCDCINDLFPKKEKTEVKPMKYYEMWERLQDESNEDWERNGEDKINE